MTPKRQPMLIGHIRLKNWRNFQSLDLPLRDVTHVLGPNASGKSNLLDALRFLRDVSKTQGGGLQAAVAERGGISKVRCLHARHDLRLEARYSISRSIRICRCFALPWQTTVCGFAPNLVLIWKWNYAHHRPNNPASSRHRTAQPVRRPAPGRAGRLLVL